MTATNDDRSVRLWRTWGDEYQSRPFQMHADREYDEPYIARPVADDEARTERIEKLRDEGFAMHAAYNEATRDRDEWRRRAESARALLKEARPHVQHSIDEGAETGIELLARIDAETRGEDGPGTRRDDETDSNPTDTRNHARAAGNGGVTPP